MFPKTKTHLMRGRHCFIFLQITWTAGFLEIASFSCVLLHSVCRRMFWLKCRKTDWEEEERLNSLRVIADVFFAITPELNRWVFSWRNRQCGIWNHITKLFTFYDTKIQRIVVPFEVLLCPWMSVALFIHSLGNTGHWVLQISWDICKSQTHFSMFINNCCR